MKLYVSKNHSSRVCLFSLFMNSLCDIEHDYHHAKFHTLCQWCTIQALSDPASMKLAILYNLWRQSAIVHTKMSYQNTVHVNLSCADTTQVFIWYDIDRDFKTCVSMKPLISYFVYILVHLLERHNNQKVRAFD